MGSHHQLVVQLEPPAVVMVSVSSSMWLLLIARLALCLMGEAKQVYPIGGDEQAQWLRALPSSRQSFNLVFGECPYCSKPITVKMAAQKT